MPLENRLEKFSLEKMRNISCDSFLLKKKIFQLNLKIKTDSETLELKHNTIHESINEQAIKHIIIW